MSPKDPTFVFDDDGTAYAYVGGKIVAAAKDADELERQLEELEDNDGPMEASEKTPQEKDSKTLVAKATHIQTPNGLKGQILGKQKGLWGDQVTIRLENGRIARFDVTADSKIEWLDQNGQVKTAASTPLAKLASRLEAMPEGNKDSLVSRVSELKSIKKDAIAFLKSAAYSDQRTAETLIVQADYELREVSDALEHIADTEAFAPPAPFSTGIGEQESLGGGNSSWLDDTLSTMIAEAEATDYDQLMDEGPETLVAETPDGALADVDGVQELAGNLVASKTAGLEPTAVSEFRKAFLARVEECRVAELESRTANTEKTLKEASTDDADGPAEGIFW